ncbi:hypothetical protein VNI00_018999 [Paramarasmius palmivorus]|uniref:Protein kinase domain-containing protein n=1 Tax=Paramarasmius palmivorus TaxID=297713 RepID=A0AAW0ATE3_9AGAR
MPLGITFKLAEDSLYHRAHLFSHYPLVHPRFNSNYPTPQGVDAIEVTVNISIHTDTSTVYAGKLIRGQNTDDIVIKIRDTVGEAEAEALCYEQLKGLQGSTIPRFYGLFRAKGRSGGHLAGILLERFGKPVDRLLEDLGHETKAQILHHVHRIHKAGIALDELEPRHVLSDGNNLRIIDFTNVWPHTCRSTYDYLTAPQVVAGLQELAPARNCPNLYSCAFEMGFWIIPKVTINDFPYNAKGMPTDPHIIKLLHPGHFFDTYNNHQLITLLKIYYQKVHKKMESGVPVEVLQNNMDELMKEAEEEWTVECVT